ncbi:MAG: glycosyltransferase family 2 protein [Candidatus Heimdallarchaeaceae archaeon]
MTISWVLLTHNRKDIVKKSFEQTIKSAGDKIDETIWVDNGSTDGVRDYLKGKTDITILNSENKGVAKGYNIGMYKASSDYILINGGDMLMPQDWLIKIKEHIKVFPNSAFVIPTKGFYKECISKEMIEREGLKVYPSVLMKGAKIFPRNVLKKAGYIREDMSLYGIEDREWAERIKSRGIPCYVIKDYMVSHIGEDIHCNTEYRKLKWEELKKAFDSHILEKSIQNNFPYYNPF